MRSLQKFTWSIAIGKKTVPSLSSPLKEKYNKLMMKLEKHSEVLIQSTTYVIQLSATSTVTQSNTYHHLPIFRRKKT